MCAGTRPPSSSMPVPRPFPQYTQTMAATSAIVSLLCFCLCVPEAPLCLPEARQECGRRGGGGDEQEGGRAERRRETVSFSSGATWLMCVSFHYLKTPHQSSFYSPLSLSLCPHLSPVSVEENPLKASHTFTETHTRTITQSFMVSAGVSLLRT